MLGMRTVPWITGDIIGEGQILHCGKYARGSIATSPLNLDKSWLEISTYYPGKTTWDLSQRKTHVSTRQIYPAP